MRNFLKEVVIVILALIIGICAGVYYENHKLVLLGEDREEYEYPDYDGPAVEANMQDTLAAIANGTVLYEEVLYEDILEEEILYEDILTENTITWDNVPTQEWP